MKTIEEVFSANLIRIRGDRSIKEVAAGSGVPYRSIQNMEGGALPRADNWEKIAKFYGYPPGTLLFPNCELPGSEKPTPEEALDIIARIIKAEPRAPIISAEESEVLAIMRGMDSTRRGSFIRFARNVSAPDEEDDDEESETG